MEVEENGRKSKLVRKERLRDNVKTKERRGGTRERTQSRRHEMSEKKMEEENERRERHVLEGEK